MAAVDAVTIAGGALFLSLRKRGRVGDDCCEEGCKMYGRVEGHERERERAAVASTLAAVVLVRSVAVAKRRIS